MSAFMVGHSATPTRRNAGRGGTRSFPGSGMHRWRSRRRGGIEWGSRDSRGRTRSGSLLGPGTRLARPVSNRDGLPVRARSDASRTTFGPNGTHRSGVSCGMRRRRHFFQRRRVGRRDAAHPLAMPGVRSSIGRTLRTPGRGRTCRADAGHGKRSNGGKKLCRRARGPACRSQERSFGSSRMDLMGHGDGVVTDARGPIPVRRASGQE